MTTRYSRRRSLRQSSGNLAIGSRILVNAYLKEFTRNKHRAGNTGGSYRIPIAEGQRQIEGPGDAIARHWEAFTHYLSSPHFEGLGIPQSVISDWFNRLKEDASASGDLIPPPQVIEEARRIVSALRYQIPVDTDIYTSGDGRVEVEVSGATGYGLSLICEPGGSALCLIAAKNASRRARYSNSSELPDGFLLKGLTDVRRSVEAEPSFQG